MLLINFLKIFVEVFIFQAEQFLLFMIKMTTPFARSFQLIFQCNIVVRTVHNISGPLTFMDFNFTVLVTLMKTV